MLTKIYVIQFLIKTSNKLQGLSRKLLPIKKATTARTPFGVKDQNQVGFNFFCN